MSRLATTGFTMGGLLTTTTTNSEGDGSFIAGTPAYDTGSPRTGTYALKFSTLNDTFQYGIAATLERSFYFRAYFKPSGTPSTLVVVMQSANGATLNWRVNYTTAGKLELRNSANEALFTTGKAISTLAYTRIEVGWKVPTAGNGTLEFRVNGITEFSSSNVNVANTASNNVRITLSSSTGGITFLADDLAINDDQGASQNTFPGEGKVRLLPPISDVARTGWVAGAGGTTNLFDALDNRPPTGVVVGSATNTSQVKDAENNTTDSFEVNIQSYSAAGLVATDVITFVRPIMRIGNSSATARSVGIQVVSNPVVTELVASTSATAETEATGWITKGGNFTNSPSVTLGTSPVIKVRKATATTDNVMVDAVGLLVEYVSNPARRRFATII